MALYIFEGNTNVMVALKMLMLRFWRDFFFSPTSCDQIPEIRKTTAVRHHIGWLQTQALCNLHEILLTWKRQSLYFMCMLKPPSDSNPIVLCSDCHPTRRYCLHTPSQNFSWETFNCTVESVNALRRTFQVTKFQRRNRVGESCCAPLETTKEDEMGP